MVTKFAGVKKMLDPWDEDKKKRKENMTLDDSLLILAKYDYIFLRK